MLKLNCDEFMNEENIKELENELTNLNKEITKYKRLLKINKLSTIIISLLALFLFIKKINNSTITNKSYLFASCVMEYLSISSISHIDNILDSYNIKEKNIKERINNELLELEKTKEKEIDKEYINSNLYEREIINTNTNKKEYKKIKKLKKEE